MGAGDNDIHGFRIDQASPSGFTTEPAHLMTVAPHRLPVSVRLSDTAFRWLDADFEQVIRHLLALGEAWAGPESVSVTREALLGVLAFISRHLPDLTPRPSLVPTPMGGLQLEWHDPQMDAEVEFGPLGNVIDAAVSDRRRGIEASSTSPWEVLGELQVSLKQADAGHH